MYGEVTGWCQKPGGEFQPGACPRSTTDEHPVRELKAKRPFPTLGSCMEQCDRRSKDASLLSQVFALQGPGCCSRTGEASPPTHQAPFPCGSALRPLPRAARTPTPAQPCLPGTAAPGAALGSARRPQRLPGPERAIGANPGRRPRPPLAHRADTPRREAKPPTHRAPRSARPPSLLRGTAEGRRSAAASPRLPERRLRAALLPGTPLRSAPLRTYPGERTAGGERGGERRGREGCAQMSAGPARCCTPSSPPEGGSSRCLRRLLLFCKGCCCRWTQPSPDMELLPPPPLLLLLE